MDDANGPGGISDSDKRLQEVGHRVLTLQAMGDALSVVGACAHDKGCHDVGFLLGFLVDRLRTEVTAIQALTDPMTSVAGTVQSSSA